MRDLKGKLGTVVSAVRCVAGTEARACDCHAPEWGVVCAELRLLGVPGFYQQSPSAGVVSG